MTEGTPSATELDIDTIVDDRTALYDQLEAQPYRILQEDVAALLTSTVEAAGRDASDVEAALTDGPLDEDWWFSITTQRALEAIIVVGDDGVLRVDIAYELGASQDLTVPSPDALPILEDGEDLTIYCLLNRDAELSATTGNVTVTGVATAADGETEPTPEPDPPSKGGRSDQPGDTGGDEGSTSTGPVTVSLIGPEGQQDTTELPRDRTMGFVVTELKQSYDVYDAEIGLYEDKRYSTDIDNSADPGPFDGETVYWQVERRAA